MSAKMPPEMSATAREIRERVLRELGPAQPSQYKTLKEMMDEEWARRAGATE